MTGGELVIWILITSPFWFIPVVAIIAEILYGIADIIRAVKGCRTSKMGGLDV